MNSRRLFDLTTMAWHPERWGREVVVVTVALDQKLPFSSHSWVWAKDTRCRMLPSKTYGTKKMSTSFRPQILENHAQLPNNAHFTSLAESQISPELTFLLKNITHLDSTNCTRVSWCLWQDGGLQATDAVLGDQHFTENAPQSAATAPRSFFSWKVWPQDLQYYVMQSWSTWFFSWRFCRQFFEDASITKASFSQLANNIIYAAQS